MRKAERLAGAVIAFALMGFSGTAARAQTDVDPHGRAHGGASGPAVFDPPQDVEEADPTLAPGTIAVDLRDADNAPVAHETITLGILVNSIAKGDSRKHLQATTDERGHVLFSGLEIASNIAYRVSSGFQGGAFAASPFQLEQAKSMHVVLHVYAVTRDVQAALVVTEATIASEVREDRLQLEEIVTLYNLGRTAWQPDGVAMALPDGFTAFNVQASMSDQGVDEVGGTARLRGTFAPGRHVVEYRWQLPLSGAKDMEFEVGLPPHLAVARAVMPAAADIQLSARGFPAAEIRRDGKGQRFLVAERRMRPDEPRLTTMSVSIGGLPTPGPERLVATLLAAVGVASGLAFSFSRRLARTGPDSSARAALLDELGELERARSAGQVGPKTYERTRRELVDALAYTLVNS